MGSPVVVIIFCLFDILLTKLSPSSMEVKEVAIDIVAILVKS